LFLNVRSYDNYISANIILQRLEAENIRAYLQDENSVTINPPLGNAIGGIKLMVHEGQAGRALDLINEFEEDYKQANPCPKCGSVNVLYIPQSNNSTNVLAAITSWLFGNYAASIKHVYHCYNCGNEWEDLAE
jgi:DNA-directed RNA polymerase subunit RPC12/RpoP